MTDDDGKQDRERTGLAVVEALKRGRIITAIRLFVDGYRRELARIKRAEEEERIWAEIERLALEQKSRRNRREDWH